MFIDWTGKTTEGVTTTTSAAVTTTTTTIAAATARTTAQSFVYLVVCWVN